MSGEKAFYKSLGHELMNEIAESYIDAKLVSSAHIGIYDKVELPNGMHVSFTEWRRGEGPFYIILYKGASDYVFELDLSMIAHQYGRFTWHLKIPSHKKNVALLETWLGKPDRFDESYSNSVKNLKKTLNSGINTPRTGYRFVDDVEWPDLCNRFLELMRRAIKSHTSDEEVEAHTISKDTGQLLMEAGDDDGEVINAKRKARRNQSRFRLNLMELYDSACAISGEGVVEVLEAAHIVSHSETGINHTKNGLLLRSDLHRLLDANLIAIDPTSLKVVVSPVLAETKYQELSGIRLRPRIDGSSPDPKYLEIRWSQARLDS